MLTTKLVLLLQAALAVPPGAPARRAPAQDPMTMAWHVPAQRREHHEHLPPPPAIEVVAPRPGYVWVEGGFEWRYDRYVRVPGHWERERPGRRWQPGRWEPQGDHHVWVRGGWIAPPPIVVGVPAPAPLPNQPPPPPRYARISISGQIFDQYRRPLPGAVVVLAGTSEGRAVTDEYGHYVFAGLSPGAYAVRPDHPRCAFGPDVMNLNNLGESTVQNFNANCQ